MTHSRPLSVSLDVSPGALRLKQAAVVYKKIIIYTYIHIYIYVNTVYTHTYIYNGKRMLNVGGCFRYIYIYIYTPPT